METNEIIASFGGKNRIKRLRVLSSKYLQCWIK